ncbi:MAG: CBS domain-containing protein [Methanobacteriota archaeon]
MLVKEFMRKDFLTVSPGEDVVTAGNQLLEKHTSCAVVEDSDGMLLGMLSKEGFVLSVKYLGGNPLADFKVSDFMEHNVETVKPDDTIMDAVESLLKVPYRIDRLPVVDEAGKVQGILTKENIMHFFRDEIHGKFKVKDLMRYDPTCVYDYIPIRDVLTKLDTSSEKRVLVLEGEKLVGIITILDLAMAFFKERLEKGDVFDWDIYANITAEHVMTRNPITIKKKADANEAVTIMLDKKIGGIPVLNDKLDGMISRTEIVKGYKIFCDQG